MWGYLASRIAADHQTMKKRWKRLKRLFSRAMPKVSAVGGNGHRRRLRSRGEKRPTNVDRSLYRRRRHSHRLRPPAFEVEHGGKRAVCPNCGAEHQMIHDRVRRSWLHLDFFQFEAWFALASDSSSFAMISHGVSGG